MDAERFDLVRLIINDCPALKLPQTFLQRFGMVAQIVPLKGLTQGQAQAIVDRLNAVPDGVSPSSAPGPGDCPELNLSNYNADDVAELNDWAVRADAYIRQVTNERNEASTREQFARGDVERAHRAMDECGWPRYQDNGLPYSLEGRVRKGTSGVPGRVPTQEEIDNGPHAGLGNRPTDYLPGEPI